MISLIAIILTKLTLFKNNFATEPVSYVHVIKSTLSHKEAGLLCEDFEARFLNSEKLMKFEVTFRDDFVFIMVLFESIDCTAECIENFKQYIENKTIKNLFDRNLQQDHTFVLLGTFTSFQE